VTRRPPVIGISGSNGGLHVGDEAILSSIVAEFRRELPDCEVVVFSRQPDHTERHRDVDRVVRGRQAHRRELEEEVARLDLLLLGGGGVLFDREARSYLHVPRVAQKLGVPTATFAIGVGPLERTAEQEAVAEVLNRMDLVTVREASAKRLLEEIGVEGEIHVTADPALLLTPDPFEADVLRAEGIDASHRLVGLSVREAGVAAPDLSGSDYHALIANAADFVVDRFGADVLFVPMERGDIRESHRVLGRMAHPERGYVLRGEYEPRLMLGVMQHLDLALGMRLHFLIFGALAGVPIVGLPYGSKVTSFLESVGLPTPQMLEREHAGLLLSSIDRSWDERDEHRRRMRERLWEVQERARGTVGLCLDVLTRTGSTSTRAHAAARGV
jgi:polysaccharide pyruvyl transferase CsaB